MTTISSFLITKKNFIFDKKKDLKIFYKLIKLKFKSPSTIKTYELISYEYVR